MVKGVSGLIRDCQVGTIDTDRCCQARRHHMIELEYSNLIAERVAAAVQVTDDVPPFVLRICVGSLISGKSDGRPARATGRRL